MGKNEKERKQKKMYRDFAFKFQNLQTEAKNYYRQFHLQRKMKKKKKKGRKEYMYKNKKQTKATDKK